MTVKTARLGRPDEDAANPGDFRGVDHAAARASTPVTRQSATADPLSALDPAAAGALIAAAADVTLVLDRHGTVRQAAFGSKELAAECGDLVGRPLAETVTPESRDKVADLLKEAGPRETTRWRQVNHPAVSGGLDVPVLYAAMRPGDDERTIVVGRDLRAVAALQQRLVSAQQALERDYARLRHAETRYRLLFQISGEAVLVAESGTGRIAEANPAAAELLGRPLKRVVGRSLVELFAGGDAEAARGLLAAARRAGRAEEVELRLADADQTVRAAASLFRQDGAALFLVQLAPLSATGAPANRAQLLDVVENLPDGLVVTDPELKVMMANAAFLDLAEAGAEGQVLDGTLARWLGRSAVDLDILVASLREHGTVRHFGTLVRGEHGGVAEVEVSAVSVPEGERPCLAFTVRPVGRRLSSTAAPPQRQLPRSVEQMTELVGRVPLKDLIRETTDVIERLCIEAALELTDDNRASAAEMLGLSRQSLYVKLRRYGLGDLTDEPA